MISLLHLESRGWPEPVLKSLTHQSHVVLMASTASQSATKPANVKFHDHNLNINDKQATIS